tara:strand:- start:772 stop:1284 length:513 start_codon:yes stop_codon:yes gene_type:complete
METILSILGLVPVAEATQEISGGGSMLGGIPMELMTMLGSSLLGGIMSIWGQSIKAKEANNKLMMAAMTKQATIIDKARKYENPHFQWTRRIIAIAAIGAIIVWPKVVAVFYPDIAVTVGWTQFNPGFLFFEGKELVKWEQMSGLVITPLDTHLVSAIVGLYFGGSLVKK